MRQSYRLPLVTVADRQHHTRPVTEADVQPGSTPQPIGKPIPLALSAAAHAAGVVFSISRSRRSAIRTARSMSTFAASCTTDKTFVEIFRVPLWSGLSRLSFPASVCRPQGHSAAERIEVRRLLKGPVLVSPKGFNRAIRGDGVGFRTTESKDLMRIPQQAEGQHIELMGDTGAGKTRLIMSSSCRSTSGATQPSCTTPRVSLCNGSMTPIAAT